MSSVEKIIVCQLSKEEQQLLRGIGASERRMCDECKKNFAQKKIERTNGIVKVHRFFVIFLRFCFLFLYMKQTKNQ